MDWPQVTVLIITYDRYEVIQRTVQSLADHLHYPNLRWLIADDASPDHYTSRLGDLELFQRLPVTFVRPLGGNLGWGGNVNRALNTANTDFIYQQEDDYVLTRDLDLRVGVALMMDKPHVGMVRYAGTAGTNVVFHQFEADIGQALPGFREAAGSYVAGKLTYLQLDGGSPTAYLYSNRPHLKRRRFHDFYGPYDVGRKLGETEERFAMRVKAEMMTRPDAAPGITILPEWVPMHYQHIGVSYQGTELDK